MDHESDAPVGSWGHPSTYDECECPGPPPPPEFFVPPPPAPPSASFCQDADNMVAADMEYCDFRVLEGSYTQTAIPSIAVIVVCSLFMLVMLLVATALLWKHKKKMQNFLPCKTSPQNHCDLAGGNSVLYEDLTNIRPRNLALHCVPEQTLPPIEVGAPSQLKLLDVKCSNYGGAGFTPMGNTIFIYPSCPIDTIPSDQSREHYNPAYEEVSDGKSMGLESDMESDEEEGPSVVSEDEFAEDELSLVDFPKNTNTREGADDGGAGDERRENLQGHGLGGGSDTTGVIIGVGGCGGGSGTSSLRGSTGDDLCKDLDSLGSADDVVPNHHQNMNNNNNNSNNSHHHQHHHHHPRPSKSHTTDRRQHPRCHRYDDEQHLYEQARPANLLRSSSREAELIEQLRQGAANSGVALGPHAYPVVGYPTAPGPLSHHHHPHSHGHHHHHGGGGHHGGRNYYPVVQEGHRGIPGTPAYTPGVYGAGELGPKEPGHPTPPPYATGGRKSRHNSSNSLPQQQPPPPYHSRQDLQHLQHHHPGMLPVPLLSELSQKLNSTTPPGVLMHNGMTGGGGGGGGSGGGSNRNSRSSSGSGGSSNAAGRNSDPHERSLTEFSTFRPRKGGGGSGRHLQQQQDIYAVDSGFASTTTPVTSRRSHDQVPRQVLPDGQKLLVDRDNTFRTRRSKNPDKLMQEVVDSQPRTVIT